MRSEGIIKRITPKGMYLGRNSLFVQPESGNNENPKMAEFQNKLEKYAMKLFD